MLDPIKPYLGAIKLAAGIAAFGVLAFFVTSYMERGRDLKVLRHWQEVVIDVTTEATVKPNKDGKRRRLEAQDVVAAIGTLSVNYRECQRTLDEIDREAGEFGERSVKADNRLKDELKQAEKKYQAAVSRISRLETTVGDEAAACEARLKTISDDSKAAWEGWKP